MLMVRFATSINIFEKAASCSLHTGAVRCRVNWQGPSYTNVPTVTLTCNTPWCRRIFCVNGATVCPKSKGITSAIPSWNVQQPPNHRASVVAHVTKVRVPDLGKGPFRKIRDSLPQQLSTIGGPPTAPTHFFRKKALLGETSLSWQPCIRPCISVNALGSVAGVRCWRPPVTDRQVTVFLMRSLCLCVRTYITTVYRVCSCMRPS